MWITHKMYSEKHNKDMWWAYDESIDEGVCYAGPFFYKAEAQQKADELNGGE